MKSEKLLYTIGMIDEGIIKEANPINTARPARKHTWLRALMPVAACAAIALLAIFALPQVNKIPIDDGLVADGNGNPIIIGQQSGAIYHDIDIAQIIRQPFSDKLKYGFWFDQKLMMMAKNETGIDINNGVIWEEQKFTKNDVESSLSILIVDPILPEGDYTTSQSVLVDAATKKIIAYRTTYYYFDRNTKEFQNSFSIFYFTENNFNAEEIKMMQNVSETEREIQISDFVSPADVHVKMPHVNKLVFLQNGAGIVIEAEADVVVDGSNIDKEKSLERFKETNGQLISLMKSICKASFN